MSDLDLKINFMAESIKVVSRFRKDTPQTQAEWKIDPDGLSLVAPPQAGLFADNNFTFDAVLDSKVT